MKKILLLVFGLLMYGSMHAQEFEKATEAVKNMGLGWNLGNTLDAHTQTILDPTKESFWGAQGVESETSWQQPKTTPELIKMMKEAGFGAIRVPVTWYNHMDIDGNIDEAWMNRVKEVADYVINEDLYCIIDIHHDTGADKEGQYYHWLKADMDNYAQNTLKYASIVMQIATAFKDYGQKLILEGNNEILDPLSSWCYASFNAPGQYDADIAQSAYDAVNYYNELFVKSVRLTGGNNATRNLLVNDYCAGSGSESWSSHLLDPMKNLKLPGELDDATEGHLIFGIHNYPKIANLENAKKELDKNIENINTYLVSQGAPVIYGEWGTSTVDTGEDYAKNRDNMIEYLKYYVQKCKENNIGTFYWMGLSDGAARSIPAFNQADLAEALAKAYHGDDFAGKFPTMDDLDLLYVVDYKDAWSELFLFGDWGNKATLKMSEYQGLRLELEDDSAVSKLQVKLYGKDDSKNSTTKVTGATTTVEFAKFENTIGNEVSMVTLQTTAGAQTVRVKKATLIKADGTEEASTIKAAWGCEVKMGEPTAIRSIEAIKGDNPNAAVFNLAGQRVSKPGKGIYIKNGKKYIVR